MSDISHSQQKLSRSQEERSMSQTILQSRLDRVEKSLGNVGSGPGEGNTMFHAASIHAAAPLNIRALVEALPLITSASSTLDSRSLLERNPPPLVVVLYRGRYLNAK